MYQFLFYCVILLAGVESCGDYYWREYDGAIPKDAIPANDINDEEVFYIGQIYVHNHGSFLGRIQSGKKEVATGFYGMGIRKVDTIVKILCAKQLSKYYWIETTTDHYGKNITKRCPVIGGYDQKKASEDGSIKVGKLHIGRYFHGGKVSIGNINYYNNNPNPWLFFTIPEFPQFPEELRSGRFEALIFSEYPIKSFKNKI